VAARWVMAHGPREQDFGGAFFGGAFFGGSTNSLGDEAALPANTPIEIFVITDGRPLRIGVFTHMDVLIDVQYVSWSQLESADDVLESYQLAGNLRADMIISDPTRRLGALQRQVSREFTRLPWVRRRCENARRRAEESLRAVRADDPLADQVDTWLLGMSAINHILLVADLRPQIGRQSYVQVREVLTEYDRAHFYANMLEALGSVHLTRRRVSYHLDALELTFDKTLDTARSTVYYSSRISPETRTIALDGSQELLDQGHHREAMFPIATAFAHCHQALAVDAPRRMRADLLPPFEAVLHDLGIVDEDGVVTRAKDMLQFLPHVWSMTEVILANNSAIRS
jgi:hypothetical protein